MDGLIGIAAVAAILLVGGGAVGLLDRRNFSPIWLIAAAAFVVLNDALLTSGYGLIPDLIGGDWNWQGKVLALAATLIVAVLPVLGWRASGLTFRQASGGLVVTMAVAGLYLAFFLGLALTFPNAPASAETVAFQLTMPGFEEEAFYRGVLLLMLAKAFAGRWRSLGVDWHWGALLSCLLFGLAHAFGVSDGRVSFDPLIMALTAGPSLIGVWLALRTRSVLLPVILHISGNAIMLIV